MAPFEPFTHLKRPLRLGVLGAARIVPKALKAALSEAEFPVRVQAIAAREIERAQRMAQEFGIPRAYGSYAELMVDPDVDAVYIALPCSLHATFAKQALRSGKHVLCEKPFSLDLREAQSTVECAESEMRLLMEAHHWRYHSLLVEVEKFIAQLGPLTHIQALFHVGIDRKNDIRKDPQLGAGVTMDFGCYALQWLNWAARAGELSRQLGGKLDAKVSSARLVEQGYGVDVALDAQLMINGIPATASCDMREGTPFRAHLVVQGQYGRVHFEDPLVIEGSWVNFEPNLAGRMRGLTDARTNAEASTTTYRQQLLAFRQALCSGIHPPTSGQNILETQGLLDEVYRVAGVVSRSDLQRWAQAKIDQ